jgi:hypothetical protein
LRTIRSDAHAHTNCNRNVYSDCNTNCDCNSHANSDLNPNAYAHAMHGKVHADAETSPHSCAASVVAEKS